MRALLIIGLLAACGSGDGEPCRDDDDCEGRCVGRRCEASECKCGPDGCDAPSPDCLDGWLCVSFSDFFGSSRKCLQACPCEEPFSCSGLYCTYHGPSVEVEIADEVPRGTGVTLRAAITSVAPLAEARWDLGGGASAEGDVIEHAWPQEGEYPVTVEIRDEDDRTATGSKTIVVCIPDGETPCDPAMPRCCGELLCDPTTRTCH